MFTPLNKIAEAMMVKGKGILAADESSNTMNKKRLAPQHISETSEMGREFRDLLFTVPDGEKYMSAVILHDTTIRNKSNDGQPFPHLLESKGIVPGIKVDAGLLPLPNFQGEEVSQGLDGLAVRLEEYYVLGARFTKWRSVIHIGRDLPSETAIQTNAEVLARYAAIVQEAHMVPMVEPEVLFEGTHTLKRSAEVLRRTLRTLFEALEAHRVDLSGLILKTSMALPGKQSGLDLNPLDISRETVHVLKDTVPEKTGGIVFLSGGQTPVQATENLNAIGGLGKQAWPITFSYSRALEEPALEVWQGQDSNVPAAQEALLHRLKLNVAAREGAYRKDMEK